MTPVMRSGERGSASVELAILTPLFGVLLAVVVLFGRVQNARADVEAAARSAARSLSLARTPEAAVAAVSSTASATLGEGRASCRDLTVAPQITAESVTVTLTCVVDLADAGILPVPGSMSVSGSATEVVDQLREAG